MTPSPAEIVVTNGHGWDGPAIWERTDQGQAAIRRHKQELRESYRQYWGEDAPEL